MDIKDLNYKFDTSMPATKRMIGHISLKSSKDEDQSDHLRLFVSGTLDHAGSSGIPSRMDFSITNTSNYEVTELNKILSLTDIPILPVIFDINPESDDWYKNCRSFIKNVDSKEKISDAFNGLEPEVREERLKLLEDFIMLYILTEIGARYSMAKQDNDKATMSQLKSLRVISDEKFDLDMFDLALKTPDGFKNLENTYLSESEKKLFLSPTMDFLKSYNKYQSIAYFASHQVKEFIEQLSDVIDEYEMYDIKQAKRNQTFGGHVSAKVARKNIKLERSGAPSSPGEPGE